MRHDGKGILGNRDATGLEIRDALENGVQEALREHKRAGRSVVVWDREKDHIVILRPDQIDVPDEAPESDGTRPLLPSAPSQAE